MKLATLRNRIRAATNALMGNSPDIFWHAAQAGDLGLFGRGSATKYLEAYRSWVYAAVRVISNTIAAGRVRFYYMKNNERVYLEAGHPLYDLFREVNPVQTTWDLWSLTTSWLELTGKAYWFKVRDGIRVPRMIIPIQPDWMRVVPDENQLIKGYMFDYGGKRIAFDLNEIVYMRYPHPYKMWDGFGPLQAAANSYDVDQSMDSLDKSVFESGGNVKSVLKTEQYISEDDQRRLREQWKKLYKG